jgi:hypothetical protein
MKSTLHLFLILIFGVFSQQLSAVTKTWTGAVSSSWNNSNNWQPTGVPNAYDDVYFDGSVSNTNCQLSTNQTAKSITLLQNFSGTFFGADNPSRILTVLENVNQFGGTINMNRSRLSVSQTFTLNGGTFIKGNTGMLSINNYVQINGDAVIGNASTMISGICTIEGGSLTIGLSNFTVNGNYTQTGGSFSKSTGNCFIASANFTTISAGVFNCNNSVVSFGTFNMTGGTLNGGINSVYFNGNATFQNAIFTKQSGAIYNNNNTLSLDNSELTISSAIINLNSFNFSNATAQLGTGNILVVAATTFNNATIIKPSGDARYSVGNNINITNCNFSHGNGLLNLGTLTASNTDFSIGSGTFNAGNAFLLADSSTFVKNGGIVNWAQEDNVTIANSIANFSSCLSTTIGNLIIDGGQVQFGTCPLYLNGKIELDNDAIFNAPSSLFELKGNFRNISGTYNHQMGLIRFVGSSTIPYSILGFPTFYNVEIQHLTGTDNKKVEIFGNIQIDNLLTFNNGSSNRRAILIENGFVQLANNLVLSNYRTTETTAGSGMIRFIGGATQSIIGLPALESTCILPKIEVDKNGGVFNMDGIYNFGNGFNVFDSNIEITDNSTICLVGGEFYFGTVFIPSVKVLGVADLKSNLFINNNLEIANSGLLNNINNLININGPFLNYGSFLNYSGTFNASSTFINRGSFSVNLGAVNALIGIQQEAGIFACNQGQVNIIGVLSISDGTFSCNNGIIAINGSIAQSGGILNGNLEMGNISVTQDFTQTNGLFDGQTGTVNIGGVLSLNGLFFRNEGTINFNGIGPQIIPALFYNKLNIAGTGRLITLQPGSIRIGAETGGFTPNTSNSYVTTNNTINYARSGNQQVVGFAYNNLTLSRNGLKTLLNNASVKNTLTINNTAIFDADGASNNRVFTLLSNQFQTSLIAPILGGGSIVGNVTAQRWTRGGIRSNRFLGSPVDTTNGITFRQIKDNVLCYGPGNTVNGFDQATVFTGNLNTYEEAATNGLEWTRPTNISNVIPKGKGFILFHLGDRTQAPLQNSTIPNAVILDFKGVPNQGNINLPIACTGGCTELDNGNGWALLANPYASPIDWESPNWTKSGISNTYYIWNPRINQYASYTTGNPGIATNGGSRYIGPGQSFFIKSTNNTPVLTATEGVKVTQFPDTLLFKLEAPNAQLRLLIQNSELEIEDETVIGFNQNAKEEYEEGVDAYKVAFPDLDLMLGSINEKGENLSVHTFSAENVSGNGKRIPLSLKAANGIYKINANQLESFSSEYTFYLEDGFSQKLHLLEPNKTIEIEVNDEVSSKGNSRLTLIINRNKPVSSTFNQAHVYPNPGNGSNFTLSLNLEDQGDIFITDMFGNIVETQNVSSKQTSVLLKSLTHLAKGMYIVSWKGKNSTFNERITIQ